MSVRAAIVGPTGYSGLHLVKLLLRHPQVELSYLASRREQLPDLLVEFPQLRGLLPPGVAGCRPIDPAAIAREADVVFLCMPNQAAMRVVPPLLKANVRVIDLSADYRLHDVSCYEKTYGQAHEDAAGVAEAVYGLTEFFRGDLPAARLVANPGCYPTCAALAIAPLLERGLVSPRSIIVNAASGVTGAGRGMKTSLQFGEHNESFAAYGTIGGHRHQPEIEQTLRSVCADEAAVLFVPHLLPISRGILETIYLEPSSASVTRQQLLDALAGRYAAERFVRVVDHMPNVRHVCDTNFCDVTAYVTPGRVVLFSAIDNMIKGASGQAVQNMNIMFGLEETAGLV